MLSLAYAGADGAPIETIVYTYDASGQRTSKSSSAASAQETPFSATYDAANRLTSLVLKGTGANGADETCTLGYDGNGNLDTKTCGANVTRYTWDAQDRLTQISALGVVATFTYDALGRRTSRTVNDETTSYVYDGIQAVGEMRNGGTTNLLTGPSLDEAIARYSATGNRTQLTDALGTVIAEAKDDGSIATRYAYTPYGLVVTSGEPSANSSQYTARENDKTGLYYYRARYYDPLIKRFVSEDPIGLDGGLNVYTYVEGNPISYVDPTGLHKGDKWWGRNSREFQRWFHQCWKQKGAQDADQEEIEEAYAEWVTRGSPTGGKCDGKPAPEPDSQQKETCGKNCQQVWKAIRDAAGLIILWGLVWVCS